MKNEGDEQEPVGYILSSGPLFDFLQKLAVPALAVQGQTLYRVVIHGHGIEFAVEESEPIIGFYNTRFVAARTLRDAEAIALRRTRDRWETFHSEASGELQLEIEEIEPAGGRFRWRSRLGFGFYNSE
jgi:hypothetical protein